MSIFIDILRIVAAFGVFLGHTNFHWFFGKSSLGPQNGQDYVILFFVLSGFVISWSVDKKETIHFKQYAFDRLTRLWSVALPALLFGCILDYYGFLIHPETYESTVPKSHLGIKLLISSFFLHESWFFSIRPGSNAPFWSLSYEFFYYLIFGVITLVQSTRKKYFLLISSLLIAGPKVLLLFPCWLFGTMSYYLCRKFPIKITSAILLVVPCGIFLMHRMSERWYDWQPWDIPGLGMWPLFYSAKFLDDYATAIAFSLFLYGSSYWFSLNRLTGPFDFLIKHIAGFSFSLYAIHFPLLCFIGALGSMGLLSILNLGTAIILTLLCCYTFSFCFERPLRKYRSILFYFFPNVLKKCGIRC